MYLRFDDLSLAVGVEPVYIYLTVKVTNVADNRVIQHPKQGLVTFLVRLFQDNTLTAYRRGVKEVCE